MREKQGRKGFTLIELLATIVILAIIMIIATPIILNIIREAQKGAFRSSVYAIIGTATNEYALDKFNEENKGKEVIYVYNSGEESSNIEGKNLRYKGKKPLSGNIIVSKDGKVTVSLYDGNYCATKEKNNDKVEIKEMNEEDCYAEISMPEIILNGSNNVNIEIKEEYVEPGYIARTSDGIDITDKVEISIRKDGEKVDKIETEDLSEYEIIYTVEEDGKVTQVIRKVNIVDTTVPILTIPPSISITVEEVASFNIMTGVSATDNSGITPIITTSGTVSALPGNYTITYTAKDESGNSIVKTRIITVRDVNAPIITLKGNNPYNLNVGESYVEAGATATDDVDGDITNNITITNNVGTNPGSYNVIYEVTDSSNNKTTVIRVVNVVDNVAPTVVFETNGNSTWSKSFSSKVTVSDAHSSIDNSSLKYYFGENPDAPADSIFTNSFNNGNIISSPNLSGNYYLWIMAKDTAGNTVKARTNAIKLDNTSPILTIPGNVSILPNEVASFNNMTGVSVTDNSGTVPNITVSGNINTVPGNYTLTYTATDVAGNQTIKTRVITVVDDTPPTVIFGTNGNGTWAKNRSTTVTVSDAHSSIDNSSLKYYWSTSTSTPNDSSFTSAFTNGGTVSSPSSVSGDYYLWIIAKDTAGNTVKAITNVFKLDNTAPVLTVPSDVSIAPNEVAGFNIMTGVSATDNSGVTPTVTTSGTISALPGSYTITYTATDTVGNQTIKTRVITVVDNTPPTVVFGTNGNGTWAKSRNTTATVSDVHSSIDNSSLKYYWSTSTTTPDDSSFTSSFTNGGTINSPSSVSGDYYLWIMAKDTVGNTLKARTNVFKLDNTVPVLTIPASESITIAEVSSFNIMTGVSATDNSGVAPTITTSGTISALPGSYTITYTATDTAGNQTIKTRIITVRDVSAPIITLNGNNPYNLNVGESYIEAGATATDDVDGDITNNITITSTVSTLPGSYTVKYRVVDSSNNATEATRVVNVIDNVIPTVVFGTNGNGTWAKSRSTTVTVSDAHSGIDSSSLKYLWNTSTSTPADSSFTSSFTNGGTINSPNDVSGDYYLWIMAKDTAGNTLKTRTNVFKLDNTLPVLTVPSDVSITPNEVAGFNIMTGVSATDNSGVAPTITTSGTVSVLPGSYTITYTATDAAGNQTIKTRIITVVDNTPPTVVFGTNGNGTWAKSRSTTVTVSDAHSSIDNSSLKYLWNTSTSTPADSAFTSAFTNGGTVSSPAGVSGDYYLWIMAKDTSGNTLKARTNVFKLDNTVPVLTVPANVSITLAEAASFNIMTGVSATDNSGVAPTITTSGTVSAVKGDYVITYRATDTAGNYTTKTRTITVRNTEFTFNFNAASELNYFTIGAGPSHLETGVNSTVEVTGGYMVQSAQVMNNSKMVKLVPSSVGMNDFTSIEFRYKKVGSVSVTAVFPWIDIFFENGTQLRYHLMVKFPFSGYPGEWWLTNLYANRGYSVYEYGNTNIFDIPSSGAGAITGRVGSASAHTSEAIYRIQLNKSTGLATIYNGYNGTTITTPTLTTSKVKYVDFNFQNDWYNDSNQSYIDYIKILGN